MHVTIIRADNAVGIDGQFLTVDCSALPSDFHALQWDGPEDGVGGEGEVERIGKPKPANTEIADLGDYQAYVDAWRTEKARIEAEAAALLAASIAPQEGPVVVD